MYCKSVEMSHLKFIKSKKKTFSFIEQHIQSGWLSSEMKPSLASFSCSYNTVFIKERGCAECAYFGNILSNQG